MKTRLVCIGFVLTMLCGCGTFKNTVGITERAPRKVFGGVRSDAHTVADLLTWEDDETAAGGIARALFVPFFLIDLPFSAIGDTLTLGQTIPASRQRRSHKRWVEDLPEIEDYPVIDDDDD